MKTAYSNVKIPLNTILGATVQALSAKDGTKLTRVTEDGRDDLVVERRNKPAVHIAWSQVKGGFVIDPNAKVTAWVKPAADFGEEAGTVPEVAAKDDTVRLGVSGGKRGLLADVARGAAGSIESDDPDEVLVAHDGEPVDDTVRLMPPKAKRTRKART